MTTFDALVVAATLGVGQRPLTITELAGPASAHARVLDDDPAAAVLTAAALLDAARRAGGLAPRPVELPAPAPADSSAVLSAAATRILGQVLAERDTELLTELLAATARAGYRVAPVLLPTVLDAAVQDRSLRPVAAAVLGERGRWLAAHRPEWLRVRDASADTVPTDPSVWDTGRPAERRAWLTHLRGADPGAARALLAATWTQENGDDRTELIAALRTNLGDADEAFLEAALDDRKNTVRHRAAVLLHALPDSAFTARAIERARHAVRIERRGLRRRLVVTMPDGLDAAAQRDGLDPNPPNPRTGRGAWALVQIIAATPINAWSQLLGADVRTLTDLRVENGLALELHTGWRRAAVRVRDAEWADALLEHGPRPAASDPSWRGDDELVAVLPPAARDARIAAALGRRDPRVNVRSMLLACPPPWSAALADALLADLGQVAAADGPTHLDHQVLRAAGRALPATGDYCEALRDLADTAAPSWFNPITRAAATLELRRRFHEEL